MGAGTCSARWRQRYTSIATTDNWQTKVTAAPEGTRFTIASGVHRGVTFQPKSGNVFVGPSSAIVNGSTVVTNWVSDGAGKWSATGFPTQDPPNGAIFGEPLYWGPMWEVEFTVPTAASRLVNLREELFRNSVRLMRVLTKNDVVSGKWWFDTTTNTAWIADDPTGQTMEHSRLQRMVQRQTSDPIYGVTFQGFVIEKYANETQNPAIMPLFAGVASRLGWTYRNFTARLNHGYGLLAGPGDIVTGCLMEYNGHLGIGGNGGAPVNGEGGDVVPGPGANKIELAHSIIRYNNAIYHHYANEGGAIKFAACYDLHVHHNRIHDNNGKGLWADINNEVVVFEDNLIYNHSEDGIAVEISLGPTTIRNNRVINNGYNGKTHDGSFWGWYNGIAIQNSSNSDVYNNYIESRVGANSWFIIYQLRDEYLEGPFEAIGNSIHDNEIVAVTGSFGAGCGMIGDYDPGLANFIAGGNQAYNNTYKGPLDDFLYPRADLTDIEFGFPLSSVQSLAKTNWEAGSTWIDGDFPPSDPSTMTV